MRGLRFASVYEMPENMRLLVHVFESRAMQAIAPTARIGIGRTIKQTKPRRDDEHNEQVVFFNRIRALGINRGDPFALAALRTFAIPNGGGRSNREAGRLKAEGVTAGISDVFCACPVGRWHGLFIEMKSRTGTPSAEQREWVDASNRLGYLAAVCRSAGEATTLWDAYVRGALT